MIEFLLVSVSLRFLLFEHGSFAWFRHVLGTVFFFAPEYWKELKSCAYCNGFWASMVAFCIVYGFHPESWFVWLVWGIVGAFVNYLVKLFVLLCMAITNTWDSINRAGKLKTGA